MTRIALYAGSFDPLTNGHIDIIAGAAPLCEELVVAIGVHPGKTPLFSACRARRPARVHLRRHGDDRRLRAFGRDLFRPRGRGGPHGRRQPALRACAMERISIMKCDGRDERRDGAGDQNRVFRGLARGRSHYRDIGAADRPAWAEMCRLSCPPRSSARWTKAAPDRAET